MLITLFYTLRRYGLSVTPRELLDLIEALEKGVVFASSEEFYYLLRMVMVKDEKDFDKFDRAMKDFFEGIESFNIDDMLDQVNKLPKDWLKLELDPKNLTDEQRKLLDKFGSPEELMKALEERLKEQHKKHQGGNRMIGTGGTSPFGAYGDHPEGVRIGGPGGKKQAAKVWEQRRYQDLDDTQRLGLRQTQAALRRLRRFARTGLAEELDLDATLKKTASKGILDLQLRPERRRQVKLLMFFDVGGSMDAHIEACERLFSAAKSEFKDLKFFYFHNCVYESVWTDNMRRRTSSTLVFDILHKYPKDYRVIFVGDASMAPYEVTHAYGSVEHMNEEPGGLWLGRLTRHFSASAWLNPEEQDYWSYTHSIEIIQRIMDKRMYPLTVKGIEDMTAQLAKVQS